MHQFSVEFNDSLSATERRQSYFFFDYSKTKTFWKMLLQCSKIVHEMISHWAKWEEFKIDVVTSVNSRYIYSHWCDLEDWVFSWVTGFQKALFIHHEQDIDHDSSVCTTVKNQINSSSNYRIIFCCWLTSPPSLETFFSESLLSKTRIFAEQFPTCTS